MNDYRVLAVRVNDLLSSYITINDDILKPSLRKVIPIPGIFKKIDYCAHEVRLAAISNELSQCESQASAATSSNLPQRAFIDMLSSYVKALRAAVDKLQTMCRHLCCKSMGDRGYTLEIYNRDMAEYNALVRTYSPLGDEMNNLWREIRA